MNKFIQIATLMILSTGTLADDLTELHKFWQSADHTVNEKATWATTYFSTNSCIFTDVTRLLGKPDSTSRTGTDVVGFRMQYDAFYRFTNGTIDLVFLLPVDKDKWEDTVLHSVRHVIHLTRRDLYKKKWEETKIKKSQSPTGGDGETAPQPQR
jgi:hypothetical protein